MLASSHKRTESHPLIDQLDSLLRGLQKGEPETLPVRKAYVESLGFIYLYVLHLKINWEILSQRLNTGEDSTSDTLLNLSILSGRVSGSATVLADYLKAELAVLATEKAQAQSSRASFLGDAYENFLLSLSNRQEFQLVREVSQSTIYNDNKGLSAHLQTHRRLPADSKTHVLPLFNRVFELPLGQFIAKLAFWNDALFQGQKITWIQDCFDVRKRHEALATAAGRLVSDTDIFNGSFAENNGADQTRQLFGRLQKTPAKPPKHAQREEEFLRQAEQDAMLNVAAAFQGMPVQQEVQELRQENQKLLLEQGKNLEQIRSALIQCQELEGELRKSREENVKLRLQYVGDTQRLSTELENLVEKRDALSAVLVSDNPRVKELELSLALEKARADALERVVATHPVMLEGLQERISTLAVENQRLLLAAQVEVLTGRAVQGGPAEQDSITSAHGSGADVSTELAGPQLDTTTPVHSFNGPNLDETQQTIQVFDPDVSGGVAVQIHNGDAAALAVHGAFSAPSSSTAPVNSSTRSLRFKKKFAATEGPK